MRYKVDNYVDSTHITVRNIDDTTVSFTVPLNEVFYFTATTSTATANVNGISVTWSSGQKFIPFASGSQCCYVNINGAVYQYSAATDTSITLSKSAGTQANAFVVQYYNVYDEITALRLQKFFGGDEENLAAIARATGSYEIRSLVAGNGKYRPIILGSGAIGANVYDQFVVDQSGYAFIGGVNGTETVAFAPSDPSIAHNYVLFGAPTVGVGVGLAARSNTADTNVGFTIDTLGTGSTLFTSHAFGSVEFEIFGGGGADHLAVASATGSAQISAVGSDANIDVVVYPKGSGNILLNGTIIKKLYTVAAGANALPACTAALNGAMATVSDGVSYASGIYGARVGSLGAVTRNVLCTNTTGPTTYAWAYN
ncbi:MAG: hypothetical protein WBO09_16945 [Methylocystis silviterrae]